MNWPSDFPSKHDTRPTICDGQVPCGDDSGKWCRVCPKHAGGERVTGDVQTRNEVAAFLCGAGVPAEVADKAAQEVIQFITSGQWPVATSGAPPGREPGGPCTFPNCKGGQCCLNPSNARGVKEVPDAQP